MTENDNILLASYANGKEQYEYNRSILCGSLNSVKDDRLFTIITGYDNVSDLLMDFNTLLFQVFTFLEKNTEFEKEQIIEALKKNSEFVYNGILKDQFGDVKEED